MIRSDAGCSVSRFAELVGVPRRTYQARLARYRAGEVAKGPWPAPVVDRIEPTVAKYAAQWPTWGHRKIGAIAAADGHQVGSPSSVKRAMARRNLLQPVRYQAERRQLAAAEQAAGALLGRPRIEDCAAPATGEIVPLVVVTDNGPAMKSVAVARWFATRAHLAHVRTRHRSPWTNGVVERWIESLKYEHLYRHDIASGPELADHVAAFTDTYNTIRPWRRTGCASSPGWATTSASNTAWNWLAARRSGRRGVSWPSMPPPPRGGKAGKLRLGEARSEGSVPGA